MRILKIDMQIVILQKFKNSIMQEDKDMKHNDSIGCVVTECKYHAKDKNFCSLDQIMVVKHTAKAEDVQCTDCGSFEEEGR